MDHLQSDFYRKRHIEQLNSEEDSAKYAMIELLRCILTGLSEKGKTNHALKLPEPISSIGSARGRKGSYCKEFL
jgi:hypothetical protein